LKYLYLDSSIIVSLILGDPKRSPAARSLIPEFEVVGTSLLSEVECQAGLSSELANKPDQLVDAEQNLNRFFARLTLFAVEKNVLSQARSLVRRYRIFPGLRSLDAIHLATATLIQSSFETEDMRLEYVTSDRKQHAAFTAEGFRGKFIE
jgi:predicted nucleic acid-binding protein